MIEAARAAAARCATLFTVATGRAGQRLVAPHLAELRPFLAEDGFEAGSWGQSVVDELARST